MFFLLAVVAAGFPAFILQGDEELRVGATVAAGTLPNLALFVVANAIHAYKHHPHWRDAGSVRIGSASRSAYITFMVGGGTLVFAVNLFGEPRSPMVFAFLACLAVSLYGAYRWLECVHLAHDAKWLARSLQMRAQRPAPSS